MFVYAMGPIDDWTGWRKPEELFRTSIDTSAAASPMADDIPTVTSSRIAGRRHGRRLAPARGSCIGRATSAPVRGRS